MERVAEEDLEDDVLLNDVRLEIVTILKLLKLKAYKKVNILIFF